MAGDKGGLVVSNSSPLINLSRVGELNLIGRLYQQIIIPGAVFDELIVQGQDKDYVHAIEALIECNVIKVQEVKNTIFVRALRKDLDYGESEVIALAVEINAGLVLLDERDAREFAGIYDLNKTGFIGMLIKAQKEGYIDSAKKCLDKAIEKGFWINKRLYHSIVGKLGG